MKPNNTNRRFGERRFGKKQYRIRNWPEYNAALVHRGSLTLWFDEAAMTNWHNQEHSGQRGKPRLYSELAITCMATLQVVYHLPLRATQGLLHSLVQLLGVNLEVPDYTTLCRRRQTLQVSLPVQAEGKSLHLVVDSTGLKVYGEGEWKVRQHGWSKHRTWRKVHLGVDEARNEILAVVASTPLVHDKDVLPDLLEQVEHIDVSLEQVSADGGYDFKTCYEELDKIGARAIISPRHNARVCPRGQMRQRDVNLRRMDELARRSRSKDRMGAARKRWKEESNYHRRSLAETAVFRLKCIFGDKLSSRSFQAQANEVFLRCAALNRMTHLGMPQSYAI